METPKQCGTKKELGKRLKDQSQKHEDQLIENIMFLKPTMALFINAIVGIYSLYLFVPNLKKFLRKFLILGDVSFMILVKTCIKNER